jgi:hypothetical protein
VRKAATVALLVVSLLHHAFVMAGGGLMYHADEGIEHAVMHLQKAGHHHHDDGSLHEEHSDESARHLQSDGALASVAMPGTAAVVMAHAFAELFASREDHRRAAPFLEGPTRPPRLTA